MDVATKQIESALAVIQSANEAGEFGSDAALAAIVAAHQAIARVSHFHMRAAFEMPDRPESKADRKVRRGKIADALNFAAACLHERGGAGVKPWQDSTGSSPVSFLTSVVAVDIRALNIGQVSNDFTPERVANRGRDTRDLARLGWAVATADALRAFATKNDDHHADLVLAGTTLSKMRFMRDSIKGSPFADDFASLAGLSRGQLIEHLRIILELMRT